jgi:predicted DNA-binding transcriptional regulator AlpA
MSSQIPKRVSAFDQLPDSARISRAELVLLTGLHRQTLWRHERQGLLPKPQKVGKATRPTWSAAQVRAYLQGGRT